MKRFLGLLLCCLLLCSVALAEEDGYTTVTSMENFYGPWTACSSNDEYEYLVLHEDGTFEAYEAWPVEKTEIPGDALMRRGAYTFDPATGAFMLEGDELTYTLKTGVASEDMQSGDGTVDGEEGMPTMLLYSTEGEEEDGVYFDPSKLFLPMEEGMVLLPNEEDLELGVVKWCKADQIGPADPDAIGYSFTEDGTGAMTNGADAVNFTYTLEDGRITITQEDGTVHHWLLQFAYRLFQNENGEPIEDEALQYIMANEEDDEYTLYRAAWSDCYLFVHDLDEGTTFSLNAELE